MSTCGLSPKSISTQSLKPSLMSLIVISMVTSLKSKLADSCVHNLAGALQSSSSSTWLADEMFFLKLEKVKYSLRNWNNTFITKWQLLFFNALQGLPSEWRAVTCIAQIKLSISAPNILHFVNSIWYIYPHIDFYLHFHSMHFHTMLPVYIHYDFCPLIE